MDKLYNFSIKAVVVLALISSVSGCSSSSMPVSATVNVSDKIFSKSLLVRFKQSANDKQINELLSSNGIKKYKNISSDLKLTEIEVKDEAELNLLKNKFGKNNIVKYADSDGQLSLFPYEAGNPSKKNIFSVKDTAGVKPNDTYYGLQWNAISINADKAWTITTGNENVKIAVIDSGVDPEHPDLKDNLLPMIDMLQESGINDYYETSEGTIDYSGEDGNGHGTHVTGILGALINNAEGVAGIAGNISILPIKVADCKGKTFTSVTTKAILRAIDEGVNVINLSLGGPRSEGNQALKDAVQMALDKGIVFVSATGNDSNRKGNSITEITVPAAYPGVISVSAVTKQDKVADYSNGGPEVEITAPGGDSENEQIYSTWPTYRTYEGYTSGIKGPYAQLSGTSMASPHVAAVAALLLTKEPNLTNQQVRVRILSSVSDVGNKGFDNDTGFGKLNAYKALISETDENAKD